jgi:hypothetical protein
MKVLQVNKVCYDIFKGKGWENWSRILWTKKRDNIKQVAGSPLSKEDLTTLHPILENYSEDTKHDDPENRS